jgi:hypothetical protein
VRLSFERNLAVVFLLTALAFYGCKNGAIAVAAEIAPSETRPIPVRVGLVIRNMVAIDELKEDWQATGLLVAKWSDPELKYRSRGGKYSYRDLPATLWRPDLEFSNEDAPTHLSFVDFYALPDGTIVFAQTFIATLSTNLDLRRFPFDSQLLPLVVQARGDDIDRTVLKADSKDSAMPKPGYAGLAQWIPLSLNAQLIPIPGSASGAKSVEFDLNVQRKPKSYVWKFIVPLLLLVIISWVTFWLSHEEFKTKDQLQSAISTLLIIVAFNITASTLLPKTEYITYIDALLFSSFIFVVISIATVVGIHLLQINQSEKRALFVRRLAGLALPVTFLAVQLGLLFAFHVVG